MIHALYDIASAGLWLVFFGVLWVRGIFSKRRFG